MCLTFFCLLPQQGKSQNTSFVIAFNRDQLTSRATLPFGPFESDPNIYGGRDELSGGTWLGINKVTGIMAILTNYRLPERRVGISRGKLVHDFLSTDFINPTEKTEQIHRKIRVGLEKAYQRRKQYSAFNLILYHIPTSKMFYICSEMDMDGPYQIKQNRKCALCNSDLFTLWPKAEFGLIKFQNIIEKMENKTEEQLMEQMQKLMKNTVKFSSDTQAQSQIFVQPYINSYFKKERKTKSTFLGIFKWDGTNTSLNIKQITYNEGQQSITKVNLMI